MHGLAKEFGMSGDLADLRRVRDTARLIHDAAAVGEALDRMAAEITDCMANSNPIVLAVMTGGLIPAVWLQGRFDFIHQLDYVHVSRYVGNTTGGEVAWLGGPRLDMRDRSVLVVDDILDEGLTLEAIIERCRNEGAREVKSAVLIRKRHERCVAGVVADFVGLEVEDKYVFGCGMDYHEHFRHLNEVYAVETEGPAS
jgi:hypoxanthine phosphoribosyltransferase